MIDVSFSGVITSASRYQNRILKLDLFLRNHWRSPGRGRVRTIAAMQPWMRKEVLNKFGRTVKNRWTPQSNPRNPFSDPLRGDIDPLPIEKRIRFWKLARGDRVRVVRGEHKGKEGVIKAIDNTRNQVIVAGLNVETQRLPESMRLEGDPLSQEVQYPLEYSDLRLVWELPRKYREKWEDIAKDPLMELQNHPKRKWRVVIDKLEISRTFRDRKTGRLSFNRIIPGLNVVVPWPKRAVKFKETKEELEKKAQDPVRYPDTPTPVVHEKTFSTPTLAYPPLPAGLELELHNPYSRFKRQKFARAIEQMAEWKRRNDPKVRESEELMKEIEKKDQNIYTSEQLRIRAANKLVKKARKMYFKRKDLTDEDVLLIAEYVKKHIESKIEMLRNREKEVQALTPLEQRMTTGQRLAHRRKRVVLEEKALIERKEKVEKEHAKAIAVRENKGRHKIFEFKRSIKPPVRKPTIKKKKRS